MIPQRSNWNHRKYLPRTIKCINRLRFCCSQFILTCVFTCIFVFTIEPHIKTLRSHTNVAPCCFIMSTNNDATTQKNTIVMQCQPRIDYYLRFKFHIFSFTFSFQSAFKYSVLVFTFRGSLYDWASASMSFSYLYRCHSIDMEALIHVVATSFMWHCIYVVQYALDLCT